MNDDVVLPVVVASAVPPVELAYQRNVPLVPAVAPIVTLPGLQDMPSVPVTDVEPPRVATTATLGVVHAGDVVVKLT